MYVYGCHLYIKRKKKAINLSPQMLKKKKQLHYFPLL